MLQVHQVTPRVPIPLTSASSGLSAVARMAFADSGAGQDKIDSHHKGYGHEGNEDGVGGYANVHGQMEDLLGLARVGLDVAAPDNLHEAPEGDGHAHGGHAHEDVADASIPEETIGESVQEDGTCYDHEGCEGRAMRRVKPKVKGPKPSLVTPSQGKKLAVRNRAT